MSSDKRERKDLIQKHLDTLEQGVDDIKETRSIIKAVISNAKESLGHLDNTEEKLGLNMILLRSINADKTNECDENTWQNYEDLYDDDRNLCASVYDYKNELKEQKYSFIPFFTDSLSDRASSSGDTLALVFQDTPAETERFTSFITEHKIQEHPTRISPKIQSHLNNIDPSLTGPLQEIIKDFFSAGTDMRYKHLLDLRSLIFDQLFDVYSPESDYSKTTWFKSTPGNTPEKGKRFCQPKYFILGKTDPNSVSKSIQNRIDYLSRQMSKHFSDLSNYGKHGILDKQATIVFNQTLTTLSEILSSRSAIHS